MEFNKFEFRIFLLLDWLQYKDKRSQSTRLFTLSWKENSWIYTFPKGISDMSIV